MTDPIPRRRTGTGPSDGRAQRSLDSGWRAASRGKTFGLLAAGAVAAALLVATFLLGSGDPGAPPRGSESDRRIDGTRPEPGSIALTREPEAAKPPGERSAAPAPEPSEIQFQTTDGNAVSAVQLWVLPRSGRLVAASDCTQLAASDKWGSVRLAPLDAAPLEKRRVVARAAGFASLDVSTLLTRPGKHAAVLRRGEHLTVRCVDTTGGLVAGARVVVSKEGPGSELDRLDGPEVVDLVPGADSERALYVATSDVTGVASFDTLPPGRTFVHAVKSGLVVVDRPLHVTLPETSEAVVTFGVLYASIVQIEGDRVLASSRRIVDGSGKPIDLTGAHHDQSRIATRLATRFPDALVAVAGPKTVVEPVVKYRVLLEKSGIQEFEAAATPLLEPPVVTTLHAAKFQGKGIPSAEVLVRLLDRAGNPFETSAPWIIGYNPPGSGKPRGPMGQFNVGVQFNEKQRLLAGSYTIESMSGAVSGRLPVKSFEVLPDEPQTIGLVVDGEWAPCRVNTVLEDGEPGPDIYVTLTIDRSTPETFLVPNGERKIRLPTGPGRLAVLRGAEYVAEECVFEVKPTRDGLVQEFTLRLHRVRK